MRGESRQQQNSIKQAVAGLLIGATAGVAVWLALTAGCAALYAFFDLPDLVLLLLSFFCIAFSSFFSGFVHARFVGKKGMVVGALNGVALAVFYLLVGLLIFSCGMGLSQLFKITLVILLSACGGIFGVNSKKIRF